MSVFAVKATNRTIPLAWDKRHFTAQAHTHQGAFVL